MQVLLATILAFLLLLLHPATANAQTDPEELSKAVEQIEYLDAMRSSLASTLEGVEEEPTIETFKEVCKPVGMRAMAIAKENGWQVRQVAQKYRNPAHAPKDDHETGALEAFAANPGVQGYWERDTVNGTEGTRYFRRIDIEASCLACHGAKGDRPQFVKEKYPQDLAYDFHAGDLRGMYSVFIPDVQAGLKEALSQ